MVSMECLRSSSSACFPAAFSSQKLYLCAARVRLLIAKLKPLHSRDGAKPIPVLGTLSR
jgi:hypothetical protein